MEEKTGLWLNRFGCQSAKGPWQMVDEVGCDERDLSKICGGYVAGEAVKAHAEHGGVERRVALCEQTGDDAGEHIATSGRGHAGIAGGIKPDLTFGGTDGGLVAFEHHIYAVGGRQTEGGLKQAARG